MCWVWSGKLWWHLLIKLCPCISAASQSFHGCHGVAAGSYIHVYMHIYISIHPSIYLSIYQSIYLSIYYLSTRLSVYLSVCLYMYTCVYPLIKSLNVSVLFNRSVYQSENLLIHSITINKIIYLLSCFLFARSVDQFINVSIICKPQGLGLKIFYIDMTRCLTPTSTSAREGSESLNLVLQSPKISR